MRYFAYGSNMFVPRMLERVPEARAAGVAELRGYRLSWHKRSDDGSGKCDVIATGEPHSVVYGVVYDIPDGGIDALDVEEGLGQGYDRRTVDVRHLKTGTRETVYLYVATDIQERLKPYHWYKAYVVAGARHHGLPGAYIRYLERIPACPDPDMSRDLAHRRFLNPE